MSKQKTLSQLKREWYAKLRKSGFEDIEQNESKLKRWSSSSFKYYPGQLAQIKQEYYYMATHFLHDYKFETPLESAIWEYHANGISAREIAKILKKAKIKNMGRGNVWLILQKLRKAMLTLYYYQHESRHE